MLILTILISISTICAITAGVIIWLLLTGRATPETKVFPRARRRARTRASQTVHATNGIHRR